MNFLNKRSGLLVLSLSMVFAAATAEANFLFRENFDDVTDLNLPKDEAVAGAVGGTWTTNPQTGGLQYWSFSKNINNNAAGDQGVDEWNGWSVARKDWWVTVAGDQQRSQFTKSTGNALIADPDEFDDLNPGIINAGYNVFGVTSKIFIGNVVSSNVQLKFDSSWRPEGFDDGDQTNNQTARVRYRVDGGAWQDVFTWDSDAFGSNFKPDSTNETAIFNIGVNGRTGQHLELEWSLTKANNDWWWAVDNIEVSAVEVVPEPGTMAALGLGALLVARRRRNK